MLKLESKKDILQSLKSKKIDSKKVLLFKNTNNNTFFYDARTINTNEMKVSDYKILDDILYAFSFSYVVFDKVITKTTLNQLNKLCKKYSNVSFIII